MEAFARGIFSTLTALLLASCASTVTADRSAWSPRNVAGLKILLVESKSIDFEWLDFRANGEVRAEYGSSGPEHREILHWRITPDGKLGIYSDTEIYDELTLLLRKPKLIVARRRGGEIVKYKVLFDDHLTRRWSSEERLKDKLRIMKEETLALISGR